MNMNFTDVAGRVSERSGVDLEHCKKVLDAFEQVLSEELNQSESVGNAFEKIYRVVQFFKSKKK